MLTRQMMEELACLYRADFSANKWIGRIGAVRFRFRSVLCVEHWLIDLYQLIPLEINLRWSRCKRTNQMKGPVTRYRIRYNIQLDRIAIIYMRK